MKSHVLPKYSVVGNFERTGRRSTDRALLKYPDLAFIRFNGIDPGFYFSFKPGLVSNISVDYNGGGGSGHSILQGGRPSVVNLSLSFTEAQIHTSGQYKKGSDGHYSYYDPDIGRANDTGVL